MVDALVSVGMGWHLLYLVVSECDCVKCLADSVVVCYVWSEENKSNNNPFSPATPRVPGFTNFEIFSMFWANRNPPVCLWKFVLFVFSCSLPLPPHIFTFFPLFRPCWQVYHLTSSPELWSPNNARYKGGNSFRVEIFSITTHRSEWSYFLSDIIINQRPSNISFNPSGLTGSGWLCWSETIYYCCSGCGCLFVTPEYYVWLPRS